VKQVAGYVIESSTYAPSAYGLSTYAPFGGPPPMYAPFGGPPPMYAPFDVRSRRVERENESSREYQGSRLSESSASYRYQRKMEYKVSVHQRQSSGQRLGFTQAVKDRTCLTIQKFLANDISPALHALMNNGHMVEAHDSLAVLDDVEADTFVEFAYTGDYRSRMTEREPGIVTDDPAPIQREETHEDTYQT